MITAAPWVFVVVVQLHNFTAGETRRVFKGIDDAERKYPYVVALVKNYRRCTGTLISPNWVLTAAHCLVSSTHIQYGDMTIAFRESTSTRKILRVERPPAPYVKSPDLGLLAVETVAMAEYAQVSAVDYKALLGHAVQYAGFGFTQKVLTNDMEKVFQTDQVRMLQVGDAVISTCDKQRFSFAPYICVAPKCSNKEQQTLAGDAGAPLFFDGKVVAVHVGGPHLNSIRFYTPVSPYLTWIHRVVSKTSRNKQLFQLTNNSGFPINLRRSNTKFQNISQQHHGFKSRLTRYRQRLMAALMRNMS